VWAAESYRLTFTYASSTPRSPGEAVSITTAAYIAVDVHGIAANSPLITIEADTAEGPVALTRVLHSEAVAPLVFESLVMFSRSFCEFGGYRCMCADIPDTTSVCVCRCKCADIPGIILLD